LSARNSVVVKSSIRWDILSRALFNICIDELIESLQQQHMGCHISGELVGCIAYTDCYLIFCVTRSFTSDAVLIAE